MSEPLQGSDGFPEWVDNVTPLGPVCEGCGDRIGGEVTWAEMDPFCEACVKGLDR